MSKESDDLEASVARAKQAVAETREALAGMEEGPRKNDLLEKLKIQLADLQALDARSLAVLRAPSLS